MVWSLFPLLLIFTTACAPPPAPLELEQLASFIFEHAYDEDDEMLTEGLENLSAWMASGHQEDAEEGYQISLLPHEAVEGLTGSNHNLSEDLIGAAIATEYQNNGVGDVAEVTALEDWASVMGEFYEYYRKEWTEGGNCLRDQGCLQSQASSESELVQIGVHIISNNDIQYRWVEMEEGWAFVHRSWLTKPPEVSSDLVEPNSQYYLAVTLPGSRSLRLQATWIDTKIVGLNVPKSLVVDAMRDQGETVREWMDTH